MKYVITLLYQSFIGLIAGFWLAGYTIWHVKIPNFNPLTKIDNYLKEWATDFGFKNFRVFEFLFFMVCVIVISLLTICILWPFMIIIICIITLLVAFVMMIIDEWLKKIKLRVKKLESSRNTIIKVYILMAKQFVLL